MDPANGEKSRDVEQELLNTAIPSKPSNAREKTDKMYMRRLSLLHFLALCLFFVGVYSTFQAAVSFVPSARTPRNPTVRDQQRFQELLNSIDPPALHEHVEKYNVGGHQDEKTAGAVEIVSSLVEIVRRQAGSTNGTSSIPTSSSTSLPTDSSSTSVGSTSSTDTTESSGSSSTSVTQESTSSTTPPPTSSETSSTTTSSSSEGSTSSSEESQSTPTSSQGTYDSEPSAFFLVPVAAISTLLNHSNNASYTKSCNAFSLAYLYGRAPLYPNVTSCLSNSTPTYTLGNYSSISWRSSSSQVFPSLSAATNVSLSYALGLSSVWPTNTSSSFSEYVPPGSFPSITDIFTSSSDYVSASSLVEPASLPTSSQASVSASDSVRSAYTSSNISSYVSASPSESTNPSPSYHAVLATLEPSSSTTLAISLMYLNSTFHSSFFNSLSGSPSPGSPVISSSTTSPSEESNPSTVTSSSESSETSSPSVTSQTSVTSFDIFTSTAADGKPTTVTRTTVVPAAGQADQSPGGGSATKTGANPSLQSDGASMRKISVGMFIGTIAVLIFGAL